MSENKHAGSSFEAFTEGEKSAFPAMENFEEWDDDLARYKTLHFPSGGLTKREYFSVLAMQAMLSNPPIWVASPEELASQAVKRADLLLDALTRKK